MFCALAGHSHWRSTCVFPTQIEILCGSSAKNRGKEVTSSSQEGESLAREKGCCATCFQTNWKESTMMSFHQMQNNRSVSSTRSMILDPSNSSTISLDNLELDVGHIAGSQNEWRKRQCTCIFEEIDGQCTQESKLQRVIRAVCERGGITHVH